MLVPHQHYQFRPHTLLDNTLASNASCVNTETVNQAVTAEEVSMGINHVPERIGFVLLMTCVYV